MKKIILDTNFLLIPAQFRVDIFSEIQRIVDFPYQLCIVDKSLDELKNIAEKQKKPSKLAVKLTLGLIKTKDLKIIPVKQGNSRASADDLIVELASKEPGSYIIATQDRLLRQRLKEAKVNVIVLRQKKYLSFG